jgi:hypothetical protein
MHKFRTKDQNEKGWPSLGLTITFDIGEIELILKVKISIKDLIE